MTARNDDRPLMAQLEAMGEAITAAKQRARDCDLAHRKASADVARLTDAVLEAHADQDDARAAKASRERAKLEQTSLREAAERFEGAKRAVARAEADRGLFARDNINGLLRERVPECAAVARAAEEAVEQLGHAHARWNALDGEINGLLRLAGRSTGDSARFPEQLATLVRDAKRAGGVGVPAPGPTTYVPAPTERAAA